MLYVQQICVNIDTIDLKQISVSIAHVPLAYIGVYTSISKQNERYAIEAPYMRFFERCDFIILNIIHLIKLYAFCSWHLRERKAYYLNVCRKHGYSLEVH